MKKSSQEINVNSLKRVFTPLTLSIYGLGSILGAGIYTVIGEVASLTGNKLWISFGFAMVVSILTSLSYAELGSRYPQSGAESRVASQAFGREWFSSLMGWLILCASIVSIATLSHAFVSYLRDLGASLPSWLILTSFIALLGFVNLLGISESQRANIVATIIEFSGLLIILIAGILFFSSGKQPEPIDALADIYTVSWSDILKGSTLAFFAFIGFEDIVNIAEEVKNPKRTLPIGIIVAASVAGVIYMAVVWVVGGVVDPKPGADSGPLLIKVIEHSRLPLPQWIFSIIALFAVANTALLNSITASRMLYGMSRQNLLPKWLSQIHVKRRTPYLAIALVTPIAITLSLLGSLKSLAGTTSLILLVVFFSMHLCLIVIKRKKGDVEKDGFRVPFFFPFVGVLTTIFLIFFVPTRSQIAGLIIVGAGLTILGCYRYFRKL